MRQTRPFPTTVPLGFTLFAMIICGNAYAQGLPATDLWLAKIKIGVRIEPVGYHAWFSDQERCGLMVDYSSMGIDHISRLAIDLNSMQIALVSDSVLAD